MEPEENWEHEIVAGQPGYIPRVYPTFRSTMGMSRRERKQMYTELLKQHTLKMIIHDLQAAQDGDCSDQGSSTSYHLSDTSGASSTNGDAVEAVLPQSSQDNCVKQEAPCAVGYNTACVRGNKASRLGNGSAFMDTEENWELDIVAGQAGYIPRVHPTFPSTIGMNRRERKQMYSELLKQHALHMIIQEVEAAQDADGAHQVPGTSPHLSGSSGVSCKNRDACCHASAGTSEEVQPQSSQGRGAKQEASFAVAHSTAVSLSKRNPCINQLAPDCLSVIDADDAIWHTSASSRVRQMVQRQDAQATVPSSARAAGLRRHPRTGV